MRYCSLYRLLVPEVRSNSRIKEKDFFQRGRRFLKRSAIAKECFVFYREEPVVWCYVPKQTK